MDRSRLVPVLEKMPYGIYILSTASDEDRHAMVVSWVTQVSWDPLRIAVGIRKNRYARGIMEKGRNFALHLLDRSSPPDLKRIKASLGEKTFDGRTVESEGSGAPIFTDLAGYLDCTVHTTVDAGDHMLFIGNVVGGRLIKDVEPLISFDYDTPYLGEG